jgi:hypothetical protein
MVTDLIIISVGLTVLLARDVYKTVRRKRKEKKFRKKLKATAILNGEEGHQYVADSSGRIIGRPIAAPRTSHNHPDRPIPANGNRNRNGNGRASGRGRNGGGYRRLWTRNGEQYYYRHGLDYDEEEEKIVDYHQSEYDRMPTPSPAYEPGPNPPPAVASGSEYPLPPPFEHAYIAGATGQLAEAQRKAEVVSTLARYGEHLPWFASQITDVTLTVGVRSSGQRPPMPLEHVSAQF